jgi:hypothetical protein
VNQLERGLTHEAMFSYPNDTNLPHSWAATSKGDRVV